ncbi:hypothetical protein GGX14DRAFT_444070 [Mycena pura]|uniref:DUF6533 domain-containing protein n=1 Tax=Mycena pura TaxID=153505 RepID=A0AAD6VJ97_9AGAR|nr:hypothetical protein GGX14DRAFT_444070 [Mycena pura]
MDTAELEVQAQLALFCYLEAAQFTLLFYDYLLTLDWEISRYWRRRINGTIPAVLFFANRYGTLLGNVPVVLMNFWTAPASPSKSQVRAICAALDFYHETFIITIQTIIGVMLILRTYALYERNSRILGFMFVFSASIICIGVGSTIYTNHKAHAADQESVLPLSIGCVSPVTQAESKGLIIAWSAMGLFDCMVFSLTLYKTLSRRRPKGLNLVPLLMRDGCIYFGVMVISNLCNILTFALGTPYTRGLFNTTTNVISSLMISRLMLNIRDPALAKDLNGDSSAVQWGVGVFSTYLESMPPRRDVTAELV